MTGVRLVVGLGGLALAAGLGLVARTIRPHAPLPVYGHVPTFRLVDQRGGTYATESMLGHVTVTDFVFTRCTASCPRLTARMGELQARLAGRGSDTRLVSFSVDPDNDTPAVLADYAAKAHADPARWTFVTGNADEMVRAVVLGFKVSTAKIEHGASDAEVTHGNWFVLADRSGAIRGYYSTEAEKDLDKIADDIARLEKEKP